MYKSLSNFRMYGFLSLVFILFGITWALDGVEKRITVQNMMTIDTAWFDSGINGIIYSWSYDSSSKPVDSKIYYAHNFSFLPDDSSFKQLPFSELKEVKVSNSFDTLILGNSIVFEDTLILGLWQVAKSTSTDSSDTASPGDSVSYKIYIPEFTWQNIDISESDSSISIANGKVIITKTDPANPLVLGSIKGYSFSSILLPAGFLSVGGTPFVFGQQSSVPDFIITMEWDSIPAGVDTNQIFLYKYLKGKLYPVYGSYRSNGTVSDTFAQVDIDTAGVYLILADTSKPEIQLVDVNQNGSDPVAVPLTNPVYRFTLSDNVANTEFKLIYGAGNSGFDYTVEAYYSDTLYGDTQSVRMNDSASSVNSSFGVRAFIIASDGVNADTENVSLRVFNNSNDKISLNPQEWTPLKLKSVVDSSTIDYIFRNSLSLVSWEYDQRKFRIFKYFTASADSANGWMEYDSTTKDYFSLALGDVVWCKSKEIASIDLGKGETAPLRDFFKIALKPRSWTDFSTPFKFDVLLKDVLISSPSAKNKSICNWIYNEEAKSYEAHYIFISDTLNDIDAVSDTLFGSGNDCYTVYNSSDSYDTLYISPLSVTAYDQIHGNSHYRNYSFTTDNYWNLSINWSDDGGKSGSVLCGYKFSGRKGPLFGPLPPSFSNVSVGIVVDSSENLCGYQINSGLISDDGFIYNLKISNNSSENKEFYLNESISGNFPASYGYCFVDKNSGEIIDGSLISVKTNTSKDIRLLIGSGDFLKKESSSLGLKFKIVSLYPNPAKGIFNLKLAIPHSVSTLEISVYNFAGRKVLSKNISGITGGTLLSYPVDFKKNKTNNISSGLYFVSVKATGEGVSFSGIKRAMIVK